MAELSARFKIIDEMSDKLGQMADAGQRVTDQWENAGAAASGAFEDVQGSVVAAASSVDGVAASFESYSAAANDAAGTTDYWTEAVGEYDKSALEAIYSTEELVEMGYKSAEALREEQSVMELCELASSDLSKAIEQSSDAHNELAVAMDAAGKAAEELADSDKVSEQTKEALKDATENAERAFEELEAAQRAAQAAMEEYNSVAESGTASIGELEAAALNAGAAADALADANTKASEATEELSKVTETATEESEQAEKSGVDAANGIASALAAAGITATVKEAAEAVYDLANAFSEAESTVVLATGATGEALDGLTESMMNAYAVSKTGSLEDTAAAVGEINTRLGYTGEALEETTELFLDFADVTGGNAASSVRSVTQLMSQWNVDASQMENILSKLTYAGQASGISVDSLSSQLISNKAILDQLGFSLDEATAMFMNFELAGTQTSTVMTGFRSALSSGAISSLNELYDVLDLAEQGLLSTEEAADIFGSRAGVAIVNAAQTGVFNIDELVSSLESADGTLKTTADAAQTLDEKWEQASNNISAAFTNAVEPTLNSISSGLAGVANSMGTFLNEHPVVTKAITALGVGLGVVAVAIAGVSAASLTAIPAVAALGTAISAAIWPITAVAAAVTAVTAAVLIFKSKYDDMYDKVRSVTPVVAEQNEELEKLEAEYERACETYGETSEEASRLKYQMDDLSASISENSQTWNEWCAAIDADIEASQNLRSEIAEANAALDDSELSNLALITKLQDLASQTDTTGVSQTAMEAILSELNSTVDGLNVSYEDLTANTEASIKTIREAAEAQAEQNRQQQQIEDYIALLEQQAILEADLADATDQTTAAQTAANTASRELQKSWKNSNGDLSGWKMFWSFLSDEQAANDAAQDTLKEATTRQEELEAELANVNDSIAEIEDSWAGVGDAAEEAEEHTVTYEEACAQALELVQEDLENLILAYDEAYEAALSSFEGQFGLFDEAKADMDATVEAAQTALDSQLAYWDSYLSNIETLKDTSAENLGITQENYEALMSYVQDGSEEAAGLAQSMVDAINNGNEEAVAELANTIGEVQAKQEEAAAVTAEWQTNFNASMEQILADMEEYVSELGFEDEAAQAASDTMSSYASNIAAGKNEAVSQAQAVANAVTSALQSANATIKVTVSSSGTSTKVQGNAKGTTNSADVFIAGEQGHELVVPAHAAGTLNGEDFYMAGENGPELIVGEPGSTVFPTSETDRLIAALNDDEDARGTVLNNYSSTVHVTETVGGIEKAGNAAEQVKRVLLEIAGSGAIEIGGNAGADKETVLAILYEYLKPVLMSIIQNEIYEEGDLAYEY